MANQTGIVGNPYLGGNVALNQTPFTNFYINTLARQQAKNEAFAKTFQDQARTLTPAGMRGQDVGALMDAKNKWQQNWYQNKDNIQHPDRDNGKAWADNNELFNKAAMVPAQSKNLAAGTTMIGKILADPAKSHLLTDDAIQRFHQHNLPINDPNHKPIAETEFDSPLFNPKPLSPTEDFALTNLINTKFKGQKVNSVPGVTDQNTYKRNDVNTYAPKPSELPEYLQMGERLYQNGQLAGEVNKLIADHAHGVNNPVYDNLNNTYKSLYGKDIEHPEEAATAMLINKNANYGDKIETVTDLASRNAANDLLQRNRQAIQNTAIAKREGDLARLRSSLTLGNEMSMYGFRKNMDKSTINNSATNYVNSIKPSYEQTTQFGNAPSPVPGAADIKEVPLTPILHQILGQAGAKLQAVTYDRTKDEFTPHYIHVSGDQAGQTYSTISQPIPAKDLKDQVINKIPKISEISDPSQATPPPKQTLGSKIKSVLGIGNTTSDKKSIKGF